MMKHLLIAGAAATSVAMVAPAASAHGHTIYFNDIAFGNDDEDVLDQLIELDADDIADIREDLADARADIRDAIEEVEDAREEARSVPGGRAIVKAALSAASAVVSSTTQEAFDRVRADLDDAERRLPGRAEEIGPDEVAETQGAIDALREELVELENALDELMDAMRA